MGWPWSPRAGPSSTPTPRSAAWSATGATSSCAPTSRRSPIPRTSRPILALARETLAGRRSSYQLDKRYRHKQGRTIWAQLNVSLVRDPEGAPRYFVSQIQDIGERRAAERALRASEEMLRQLAENLREVVWLRDLDANCLLYLSPAYERVFRRPRAEFGTGGSAWLDAIHPDDRERVATALADQGREEQDAHFRFVEVDGTIRWIHARTFPIRDASGRSYRVAGIAEDITERRRVEEQLHHAQKLDAFGQLAGGVAHDFNNLLAVILPHAEMAARTRDLAPRVTESLSAIGEAAARAATLTRQLLQLGRRNVLQPRDLDLNEEVTRFVRMLRRVLREDLSLHVQLASAALAVSVDTNMLDQVLMNLALNARDAMPDGGTLTFATSTVALTDHEASAIEGASAGRYACLEVTDSGHGIAPEHQARLFEPFFTTKEPGKGTGLGLATVRGIVQQHRGAIEAVSRVGHGTTFRVLLPALERDRAQAPDPVGRLPRGGSETILVVEDEPAVRATTMRTLEHHGYQVVPAVDGADALRVLDQRGPEIALVITDLVMPGTISGRDLVVKLQARQPAIKLVLMSGYSPDVFGHELQLRGGDHFVPKPVSVDRLLDVVRTSLDRLDVRLDGG